MLRAPKISPGHPSNIQRGVQNLVYTIHKKEAHSSIKEPSGAQIVPVHPTTLSEETGHCGDEAPEVDLSWVSTSVVPAGFFSSTFVLVLDLAPPRSSAFSKASVRLVAPIPYWSRTSGLAGAGDSNSGSVPVPVFGNAITSRIDGVLHSIDINLSNPVYGIAFGLRFEIACVEHLDVFWRDPPNKHTRGFRKRAGIRGVVGVRDR